MQAYITRFGWIYRVMERDGKFRARYQKPGQKTWYGSNHVIAKMTAEEAQVDLDRVAAEQGWEAVKE